MLFWPPAAVPEKHWSPTNLASDLPAVDEYHRASQITLDSSVEGCELALGVCAGMSSVLF